MKNKKPTKSSCILTFVISLVMFAAGVFLFVNDYPYVVFGKTVNLNEVIERGEPYPEHSYVTYTPYMPIGAYATITDKIEGIIPIGKAEVHAIITEDNKLISAQIKSKKTISAMENAAEAVYEGTGYNPVTLTGYLGSNDYKIGGYLEEMYNEFGLKDMGVEPTRFSIDTSKTRLQCFIIELFGVGMGILCFVFGIKQWKGLKEAAVPKTEQ